MQKSRREIAKRYLLSREERRRGVVTKIKGNFVVEDVQGNNSVLL